MIISSGEGSQGLSSPLSWAVEIAGRLNGVVESAVGLLLAHGLTVAVLAVAGALAWRSLRGTRAARLCQGGRQITILAPPQVEEASAEALWRNLHALIRPGWRRAIGDQPHLVFQYAWAAGGLTISVWTPLRVPPGLVEHAIEAAWPGARTSTEPAADPLPSGARCEGGRLRLAFPEWFPLRTDHEADPLRQLLGAAVGLNAGEQAAVQILARPASGRRTARSLQAARAMRTGGPPPSRWNAGPLGPLWRLFVSLVREILDLLEPGPVQPRPLTNAVSEDPSRGPDIRLVLDKAAHPGWEVEIRYAVATAGVDRRAGARLRGHAHALASAFALHSGRNGFSRRRLARPAEVFAARRLGRGDLLSVPELAALAHLPTDAAVPGLARAGANAVPAPPNVSATGKVLGVADAGERRPVALAVTDARHHLHVLGAIGVGKSTLLLNLVLQDADEGRGAVVIDPKGDLISDVLERVPKRLADRVVLFDPVDDTPPSLNMLEGGDPELVVDQLVGIFRRIFQAYWGPRTDDVLRAACLTLLAGQHATLADVPQLLTSPRTRRRYVTELEDPVLKGFWDWYERLGENQQGHVTGPVMNKLRVFLLRRFVRDVVGNTTSSFDMADVLDGGLCLVRVPKGILGDDSARLLGSFLVARTWQAAIARAARPEHTRRDACLYVDECHNFLTLPGSFDEMAAEARGYRLSLVLAHQHLAQLPRELREALSANARNKLLFAVSPEDAHGLQRHVAPRLTAHDLAHLGGYQAAARLLVDGVEQPAFTLRTLPALAPIPGRAAATRAAARHNYGRTAEQRRQARQAARPAPLNNDPRRVEGGSGTPQGTSAGASPATPGRPGPAGPRSAGEAPASPGRRPRDWKPR